MRFTNSFTFTYGFVVSRIKRILLKLHCLSSEPASVKPDNDDDDDDDDDDDEVTVFQCGWSATLKRHR